MDHKTYYFTFGHRQETRDGFPLRNHWVRVVAEDYATARCIFIAMFAIPNLPSPEKWSMQYKEEDFNAEFFRSGELMSYKQGNIVDLFQISFKKEVKDGTDS
jgi:hypothetical protein